MVLAWVASEMAPWKVGGASDKKSKPKVEEGSFEPWKSASVKLKLLLKVLKGPWSKKFCSWVFWNSFRSGGRRR